MSYDLYSKTNQYIIDGVIGGIAFYLAYQIRFDGAVPPENAFQMWALVPAMIAGRLLTNGVAGACRSMWRYVSIRDALLLAGSYGVFSSFLLLLRLGLPDQFDLFRIPLSIIVIEPLLSFPGSLSARLLRRILYQHKNSAGQSGNEVRRILLLGAGAAGVMTAKELLVRPDRKVIGFLDDNPRKIGAVVSGVPVLGPLSELATMVHAHRIDEVVVCIARAPRSVLKRIWQLCEGLEVRTYLIPSLTEMIEGEVQVSRLREIKMEDLLDRETVDRPSNTSELERAYGGKRILITGAGGSIGSELTRQLAHFSPASLLLLDKDENGLYELQHQLDAQSPKVRYQLLIGDIRDQDRVRNIFRRFTPEIVFHAAAHKHVPLMELNPAEAILNNVFGTKNVLEQACESGASLFVYISTDKAVNPANVMGASKRLGEMLVQRMGSGMRTRFACVRFGNVMNSRGSVIPFFQKQITAGGPITLTDPNVTRYFMTIPEAVQLVTQVSLLDGDNGSIYVLDMGDPIRIMDLIRDLIELAGLRPDVDIRIETIGLRPGEKLREELAGEGESLAPTKHQRISIIPFAVEGEVEVFAGVLDQLYLAAQQDRPDDIYRLLEQISCGFQRSKNQAAPESTLPVS